MCSPNAGVVGTCDRILYGLVLHDFPYNQVFFLWAARPYSGDYT